MSDSTLRDSTIHTIIKQDSTVSKDSTKHSSATEQVFHRPLAVQSGGTTVLSRAAIQYYGSSQTLPAVIEDAVAAIPLMLDDQGYGRETFLSTSRTSEPLISSFLNGVLPLNDPISGNSILNYYPVELASEWDIQRAGEYTSLDHAASDVVNGHIETFRAPVPYSRFHYTQELGHEFSNFEGLFSFNPTEPLNLTFSVYRRASGTAAALTSVTLNPRTDDWWVRGQSNYDTKNIHALFFVLYTSAFSGMNGGTFKYDSTTDIFDEQLAPVAYPNSFDHRTRVDVLGQSAFSLLSEKNPTILSGYLTVSHRQLVIADSNFPTVAYPNRTGDRFGFDFQQPLGVSIGAFSTRALLRADAQFLSRSTADTISQNLLEKRYSAMASDSISLGGAFGISANGYFRWTLSQLALGGIDEPDLILSNFGLEGSARLSRALSVTAQFSYARDRATLSPDPLATYELRNLGAFASLNFPLGARDSFALTAGVLDRTEPEGIVFTPLDAKDSLFKPSFSSVAMHTRGINSSLNCWLSDFRFSAQAEYLPNVHPLSIYSNIPALRSDISTRIFGAAGIYYEDALAENNFRLSLGTRLRYFNRLMPALTYDPASDYYGYRGLTRFGTDAIVDSRLTSPVYLLDVLASALIDQRAQLNIELLNVLGTPYFSATTFPREGFTFRLDVTWAFLD